MAIDVSTLSLSELQALIESATARYMVVEAGARTEEANRKIRLAAAVTRLQTLLGPATSTANQTSINGVLAYGDTVIQQNPGTAAVLIMHGMKEMAETLLDISTAMANS
jgi:hypothetical protein